MGKRGPQKTPTARLVARGSWRAKKRPDQTPPDAGVPEPPAWLKPSARSEWNYVSSLLDASGVLTRRDRTALAAYCHAVADYLEAEADIDANGLDQVTESGYMMPRPAVARKAKAFEQMVKLGAHFGLTPSTRATIKENGEETKDKTKGRFFSKTA